MKRRKKRKGRRRRRERKRRIKSCPDQLNKEKAKHDIYKVCTNKQAQLEELVRVGKMGTF